MSDRSCERGCGYLPDVTDDGRDWRFDQMALYGTRRPPSAHVILPRVSPSEVVSQGSIQSCVAAAGFAAMRLWHAARGNDQPLGAILWGYFLARAADGVEGFDIGSRIRSFFRMMDRFGFPSQDSYPHGYDISKVLTPPPPVAYRRAFDQKGGMSGKGEHVRYRRLAAMDAESLIYQLKYAIGLDMPVVFGTEVDDAFVGGPGSSVVGRPDSGDTAGHAMVALGYDEHDRFMVLSSWGPDWGMGGYAWLTPEYMTWSRTRDLWVLERAPRYSDA